MLSGESLLDLESTANGISINVEELGGCTLHKVRGVEIEPLDRHAYLKGCRRRSEVQLAMGTENVGMSVLVDL